MAGEASGEGRPATLADKVDWLIEQARPAGGSPLSNSDVCRMIYDAAREEVSVTTVWKLRTGKQTNPQLRVLQALATTFGVDPSYFFDAYNEGELGLLQEQVELLALVKSAGITSAELRTILGMDSAGRRTLAGLIGRAVRAEAQDDGPGEQEDPAAP
jgi:transcriptional regulator with XRE-family HTH domain